MRTQEILQALVSLSHSSDYSINTALYSGFTAGKIHLVIPNNDTSLLIPDDDPLFNTVGYKVPHSKL